jgi:hypothetical protein
VLFCILQNGEKNESAYTAFTFSQILFATALLGAKRRVSKCRERNASTENSGICIVGSAKVELDEFNWYFIAFLVVMIALISLVCTKVGAVVK